MESSAALNEMEESPLLIVEVNEFWDFRAIVSSNSLPEFLGGIREFKYVLDGAVRFLVLGDYGIN